MMMMMMMMMMIIDILFIMKFFITITTGTVTTITGDDEYHHNHYHDNNNKNNHHHHRHHHFVQLLCPSSSIINFNIDGYFTYPIDLFYPKYFDSLLNDINYHHQHHQQHDNKSVNNHNYSHYFNKKQIYHHTFRKTSNIDELLQYIHDNSNMTGSPHHDLNYHHSHYDDDNNEGGDDPYNIEVYNCSKPDYDNANIKYHPHSHHVCVTNRLFKCPISIHDIIDATNFMINDDHQDNKVDYDNYSNQHEYDNQDDHYKQPLHTLHVSEIMLLCCLIV